MRRIVLAAAFVVLIGAALPATASALSRKQANAIAMRSLHVTAGKKPVILFGLPKPLKTGTSVVPADLPRGKAGRKVRVPAQRLRHRAWLYWLDQVPFAWFSHKSRYLLVDDTNGRILKNARLGWYPSVNGKRPPFVSPKGYRSKLYRVYTRVPPKKKKKAASLSVSFTWPLATIPPGALKGECVLIVSDYSDPFFQNDYDAFSDWARKMKIPTFFATGSGPDKIIPDGKSRPPDDEALRDNVKELVTKQNCKDILIYLNGHGQEEKDGPPEIITRAREVETDEGVVKEKVASITATGLYLAMLQDDPSIEFKVKIDSCFSGRFVDDYRAEVKRGKLKNLKIIEASSPADKPSIGEINAFDPVTGQRLINPDNPNNLSEFTNQNLTGLTKFFDDQALIAAAVAQGGSLMAHALDEAFDLGEDVNLASDVYGIDPVKFTNFGLPKPDLKYIGAVFPTGPDPPEKFTTTYTAVATGQGLTFHWAASIPADPGCIAGFTPNVPKPNQAKWFHADVSEGGPCNHFGTDHPGTVFVVVTNAEWACTALYNGTHGGQGPPGPPCTRR